MNTKLDGLESRFSSQFMKWYGGGVGALASAFLGMSFLIGRNDKDVHDKIASNDKALSDKFCQTAAEVAAVRATTNCVDSKLTGLMSGGAVNGRVEDSLKKG